MNGGTANPQQSKQKKKRVLVFGWGAAAAGVLDEIAEQSSLAEVSCISHTSQASECNLQEVCLRHGFNCTLTDSDDEVLSVTRKFEPDLILSASYRKRIHGCVLELAADCINFHPSLLPRHRGCWSGFWAVFEGDAETGVTCHRMVEHFDCGRILHQERLPVLPGDTAASLYRRIIPVTVVCARQVLGRFFGDGLPEGAEQSGEGSYHFRKLPFGGVIQPEWSDEQVERFIRAMHFPPFEGAVALLGSVVGAPDVERVEVESLAHFQRLKPRLAAAPPPGSSPCKRKAPG